MIVRVLRAQVRPGRVAQFNMLWRQQLRVIRQQPGIQYVNVARRVGPDGGQEAILFEEWRDAAALYQWAGKDLTEPRLVDGVRDLTTSIEVSHYEALVEAETADAGDTPGGGTSGGMHSGTEEAAWHDR